MSIKPHKPVDRATGCTRSSLCGRTVARFRNHDQKRPCGYGVYDEQRGWKKNGRGENAAKAAGNAKPSLRTTRSFLDDRSMRAENRGRGHKPLVAGLAARVESVCSCLQS